MNIKGCKMILQNKFFFLLNLGLMIIANFQSSCSSGSSTVIDGFNEDLWLPEIEEVWETVPENMETISEDYDNIDSKIDEIAIETEVNIPDGIDTEETYELQRTYTCVAGCRNGSEECDDERFDVNTSIFGDPPIALLVCIDGNGGIAFIATNSGPQCSQDEGCCPESSGIDCPVSERVGNEGNFRCQGWERCGCPGQICPCGHAWDAGNQEKIASLECTAPGLYIEVDLSAYSGSSLYVGVHDNPAGGGHYNEVCVAKWD